MVSLVTVFGGSGFVGRYVAQALLRKGVRVRIAARDPRDAWYLKPLGGLGQTQFVAADITKPETVRRALAGADGAVNLVGVLAGNFEAIHVRGSRTVAEAAASEGLEALVHISALGADSEGASLYAQSKGRGEQAVLSAFAKATILRPSVIFGPEDRFINRFARMAQIMPILPVVRPKVRFQPVYVGDVAKAVVAALQDPRRFAGKSFDLGGPETMSMLELNHYVASAIGRDPMIVEAPDGIASLLAKASGWMPGAPISWDQWLSLQKNNVVAGVNGLSAMGIAPTPLEAVAPSWLVRYRRHGRFSIAGKTA